MPPPLGPHWRNSVDVSLTGARREVVKPVRLRRGSFVPCVGSRSGQVFPCETAVSPGGPLMANVPPLALADKMMVNTAGDGRDLGANESQ